MNEQPKPRRNMAWARREIWKRLAATAENDVAIGDWMVEDYGNDEPTVRRLTKASQQVADTIRKTRLKP